MQSLIEQLGLGQEIIDLHRLGMPPSEIRKKLIANHPEMQIIPSVPVIYVFLRDNKELPPGNLTGIISQDVMALSMKVDELIEDMFRIYQIPKTKRKYISTHRKKIIDFVKELEKCYANDDIQEFKAWQNKFIDNFRFIVLEGLKTEFPTVFFDKRAFELNEQFVKSMEGEAIIS